MKKAGLGFISFIYLPVVFSFMSKFSLMQQFLVLLIPIASDTFAYFVGIAVGKHKIWVSVSPKKSVEGCAAGLLVSILILLYFAYCQHVVTAPFPLLLLLGITLGVLAQLGDFSNQPSKEPLLSKTPERFLPDTAEYWTERTAFFSPLRALNFSHFF